LPGNALLGKGFFYLQGLPGSRLASTVSVVWRHPLGARACTLSGKALSIDEAHHASADGLSQIVSVWHERGGWLFRFTPMPYRGDGRPVALKDIRLLRRSLAEHMAEGCVPGRLDSEVVARGNPSDSITAGQFTGTLA
jgi:hypothetical protein